MHEKLLIYAIFDKKSERFDTPFFTVSEVFGKRRFLLMLDEEGALKKWPEDFNLQQLGTVNIITGNVESKQKLIMEAKSVVKQKK